MRNRAHATVPQGRATGFGMLGLALVALVLSSPLVEAKPGKRNLGGGLEQLAAPARSARSLAPGQASVAGGELELTRPMIKDSAGRPLVRISLNGKVPAATVLQGLKGMAGVKVTASDLNYRAGVIEAYVPTDALAILAGTSGVLAVVPTSPRVTNVGAVTSQGVVQHRVDQIAGVDGSGITVGVMSDSYDTKPTGIGAADDVATGDLPGPGNPVNSQPVVVLEDFANGTDEGRAMLQIVHDMAPKARLGFATANTGEVGFANNIRALAGFPDASNTVPGFKADVIVDDIIYLAEPFFQDGIIAQAVDDVAKAGVSYFSSAGNRPATQAYDSKVRIVPADPSAWASTNLDFSSVDPALYAGGFHNFVEKGSVDIAQTVAFGPGNTMVFQWNEPFDPQPPTPVGPPLAAGVGTVPIGGTASFTFNGTAGTLVEIFLDEDDTTTGTPNPDLTFSLVDPNGLEIAFVDTGTNPESLTLELPLSGSYTVIVDSFQPDQFGDFLYRVQQVEIVQQVLSDYNVLLFLTNGTYIGASSEQNLFTNRPLELFGLNTGSSTINLQIVVARANVPNAKKRDIADRIRYVGFGTLSPQEYFSYLGPVTYGHNSAEGAMGVAAYAFYAPFIPESFTSPGPSTIYFDTDNRRYKHPKIRQKPDMAAMDGANTTFFFSDASQDPDTFPNFFGTSASAPHAAAIAALVLDAAGGPGSVKPDKMRKILQDSAFPHDLDPFFASGAAWSKGNFVAVNASADPNSISQFDPNVFKVWNGGRNPLQSLSINGNGGNRTQTPKGVVFDERIGAGQSFIVGQTIGLTPGDVSNVFTLPAALPGVAGQWQQLNLSFRPGSFGRGDLLGFGVDRDEADAAGPNGAVGGNSADLLGGGVLLPQGTRTGGGATFLGSFEGGDTFHGRFWNFIGKGYSQVDGFGFVNAEAAVNAVSKPQCNDDAKGDCH